MFKNLKFSKLFGEYLKYDIVVLVIYLVLGGVRFCYVINIFCDLEE